MKHNMYDGTLLCLAVMLTSQGWADTGDPMRDVDVSLGRKPPHLMPIRDGGISYEALMGSMGLWVGGKVADLEVTLSARAGKNYDFALPDLRSLSTVKLEDIRIYRLAVNCPTELDIMPGQKGGYITWTDKRTNVSAALQVGVAGDSIQVMSLTFHGAASNGPSWGSGWRNLGALWERGATAQTFTRLFEGDSRVALSPQWAGNMRTAIESSIFAGTDNPSRAGGILTASGSRESPLAGRQPWLQVGYCGPVVVGGEGPGGTDSFPRALWWPKRKENDLSNYLALLSAGESPLFASSIPGVDIIVKKPPGNAFAGSSGATLVGKFDLGRGSSLLFSYLRDGKAGISGWAHLQPLRDKSD